MRIAVLAVQGAFAEHESMLHTLGADCVELRKKEDLNQSYDGLILPGGESTVQGKLLHELELFEPLRQQIEEGLPVLATCAGLILLASHLSNDEKQHFQTLPVTVRRNAYGRQLGSFRTIGRVGPYEEVPMVFIRAPYIEKADPACQILAEVDHQIVAVQYKNQIALSFHPELEEDTRIHELFLQLCEQRKRQVA